METTDEIQELKMCKVIMEMLYYVNGIMGLGYLILAFDRTINTLELALFGSFMIISIISIGLYSEYKEQIFILESELEYKEIMQKRKDGLE